MAHQLPKLRRLKLGRDAVDIDYYLTASYDNIGDASAELPAVVEWINEQNQEQVQLMHVLKGEIKEAEAAAFLSLARPGFEDSFEERHVGVKKTTDALNHAVALDPEVREKKIAYAHAVAMVERLRQLQSNLSAKLDIVRSSEATRRKVFLPDRPTEE